MIKFDKSSANVTLKRLQRSSAGVFRVWLLLFYLRVSFNTLLMLVKVLSDFKNEIRWS